MIVYLQQSHLEGREEPVLSLPSTTYQETRFRSTLSTNYCYQSLSENIEFFRSQFRRKLLFPRQIKTAESFFRTLSYNVFCSKPCYCMKDTYKRKVYSMLLCRLLLHLCIVVVSRSCLKNTQFRFFSLPLCIRYNFD